MRGSLEEGARDVVLTKNVFLRAWLALVSDR